ncbi:hypothetical protein BHE74_00028303 [Ensete ventricosum]|nr:hypothetical protein BHE74_00028303 [Ensete ventricosum]
MSASPAYRLEFSSLPLAFCSPLSACRSSHPRPAPSSARPSETMSAVTDDAAAAMDAVQRRLMFEDECILVDEQDNVVGHESKYNCHLMENIESRNVLHRAFSVFLFNSKYELLLQHLSLPGVRNAAQRKLFDELGIPAEDVPVDRFTPLGRMLYKAPSDGKWGEHEGCFLISVDYLLFVVADVKLLPNPDEVADVKYVNREQLKELLEKADAGDEGVKLSPWFRLVVDNFLTKWWDCVESGTLPEVADMNTIHKLV